MPKPFDEPRVTHENLCHVMLRFSKHPILYLRKALPGKERKFVKSIFITPLRGTYFNIY